LIIQVECPGENQRSKTSLLYLQASNTRPSAQAKQLTNLAAELPLTCSINAPRREIPDRH
jgi:hypothetical protein